MAEVVLFHHAHGLTPGIAGFAETLRVAGHTVHTPDLFAGERFASLEDGLTYVERIGATKVLARGVAAVEELGAALVYIGFSLGVLPAQYLAQSRDGAAGAVLIGSCLPVTEFGSRWPHGVPVQIHAMNADPIFTGEGDAAAAQELIAQSADGEMFLYPGTSHLFADSSIADYDDVAAAAVVTRTLELLRRVG